MITTKPLKQSFVNSATIASKSGVAACKKKTPLGKLLSGRALGMPAALPSS
jgi:hypothetical protein